MGVVLPVFCDSGLEPFIGEEIYLCYCVFCYGESGEGYVVDYVNVLNN